MLCYFHVISPSVYNCEGAFSIYNAEFGQGIGPILLDDVNCNGFEKSLLDCQYVLHDSNCGHHQDVGVECFPGRCIIMSNFVK